MDNQPHDDEKRRFSRVHFDTEVLVSSDEKCSRTKLIDISIKGALIEVPAEMQIHEGQELQLEVNLDHTGSMIAMNATVTHITEHHAGLKCNTIDAESIIHLRRLVELNLGDAELVNRELMHLGQ